jgi:hypothetical protein
MFPSLRGKVHDMCPSGAVGSGRAFWLPEYVRKVDINGFST